MGKASQELIMDPTASVNPTTAAQANTQLQDAFNAAIIAAAQTLKISTEGQAQLNALRARPN